MSTSTFLIERGWRNIGTARGHSERTPIKYWDHPNHQPDRHGAFTTTSAAQHQKEADKYGCDCVKAEK